MDQLSDPSLSRWLTSVAFETLFHNHNRLNPLIYRRVHRHIHNNRSERSGYTNVFSRRSAKNISTYKRNNS
jgi:hypothetical protein